MPAIPQIEVLHGGNGDPGIGIFSQVNYKAMSRCAGWEHWFVFCPALFLRLVLMQ